MLHARFGVFRRTCVDRLLMTTRLLLRCNSLWLSGPTRLATELFVFLALVAVCYSGPWCAVRHFDLLLFRRLFLFLLSPLPYPHALLLLHDPLNFLFWHLLGATLP